MNRKWGWLFERLDALEFGETWFEPVTDDHARFVNIASRYSRMRNRNVRALHIDGGVLFVRCDHEFAPQPVAQGASPARDQPRDAAAVGFEHHEGA